MFDTSISKQTPVKPNRSLNMSGGKIEKHIMCPRCGTSLVGKPQQCSRCYQVIEWK